MEKILYNTILNQIQKKIDNEKEKICGLQKNNNEFCNIKTEIVKLLEIIEYYKTIELEKMNKNLIIYCNGNPYTVLNIILIAIVKNCNIKIDIDNTMVELNKYILEIVNEIIKEHKLQINIKFLNSSANNNEESEKIICIDRMNQYSLMKRTKNVKSIPYKGIDMYMESDVYEELFQKIYDFVCEQNIDMDVFNDESIESMLTYGTNKRKVILTENKETIEKYKNKGIYINENPFKNEKDIFDDEMIKHVVLVQMD